jgi:hypothetical protein
MAKKKNLHQKLKIFNIFQDVFFILYLIPVPQFEDKRQRNKALQSFVICINKNIDDVNLIVRKALDEERMDRDSYLILCNKTDRSNEPSKLSMKAMVDFAPYEMEYFKLVLECIMSSEDAEVSV